MPKPLPPPPWKLRAWPAESHATWWEVVPDVFVLARNFVDATNEWRANLAGASAETLFGGQLPENLEPAPLRDLEDDFFEVEHGWTVWANNREQAVREYESAGGRCRYGQRLAENIRYKATINEVPNPASEQTEEPLNRYRTPGGQSFYEVEPGRVIAAVSEASARRAFAESGSVTTISVQNAQEVWGAMPDSADKPQDKPRIRRFKDRDGDLWWLIDEDDNLIVVASNAEQALELRADADEVEDVMHWGPFRELDDDGNTTAEYEEAEELLNGISSKESPEPLPATDGKKAPTMTAAPHQAPPFVDHLIDAHGRDWFEMPGGRWVLGEHGDTDEEKAATAWRKYSRRLEGGDESYGRRIESIKDNFAPVEHKGFIELKVTDSFRQSDLLGSVISHDKCRCVKLDDEEEERAKWMRVEGNTFCVDCGKLRP